MAKVDTNELAQKTGLPTRDVEKVVGQIIADKNDHKRKSKPEPPEGGISLRAAARKYRVYAQLLSAWRRIGIIKTLLETQNEIYVDENSVIKVVTEYKKDPGRGKRTIKRAFLQK